MSSLPRGREGLIVDVDVVVGGGGSEEVLSLYGNEVGVHLE